MTARRRRPRAAKERLVECQVVLADSRALCGKTRAAHNVAGLSFPNHACPGVRARNRDECGVT